MGNTNFFSELLKLGDDWRIKNISKDESVFEINIDVEYKRSMYRSIENEKEYNLYDRAPSRSWQHLGILQYKTYIHSAVPRYINEERKVKTVPVPWAESYNSFTHLFGLYVINVHQAIKVQSKTAQLCKTSESIVRSIMDYAVELGMERRGEVENLQHISIDEKAFKKGHQYATILMDDEQNRIIEMVEGRKQEQAELLLYLATGKEVNENIETVTLDMWEPYMNAMGKTAPNAALIHDKFHLFQYLSKAIDKTRKSEIKEHEILKGMKYTVLKNKENRTEKQEIDFESINAINLKTAQAWTVRENFKTVFEAQTFTQAIEVYQQWLDKAARTGIKYVHEVIKTFSNHLEGI